MFYRKRCIAVWPGLALLFAGMLAVWAPSIDAASGGKVLSLNSFGPIKNNPTGGVTGRFMLSGDVTMIKLDWIRPNKSRVGLKVRYRIRQKGKTIFSGWSGYSYIAPIVMSREAQVLEFEILFWDRKLTAANMKEVQLTYRPIVEEESKGPQGAGGGSGGGGASASQGLGNQTGGDTPAASNGGQSDSASGASGKAKSSGSDGSSEGGTSDSGTG